MEIKGEGFNDKIKETCIVDFFATWCPPCQMLAPVFEKVSQDYEDKLNFYKINIDENIEIAEQFQITHVPTLVLFKDGNVAGKVSGFMDEKQLIKFIEQVI